MIWRKKQSSKKGGTCWANLPVEIERIYNPKSQSVNEDMMGMVGKQKN